MSKNSKKEERSSLTLQFIPYSEIEKLQSEKRIDRLVSAVKENKIVLLEGRLRSDEEAELIRKTMEEIDEKFKGIEISPINSESGEAEDWLGKTKNFLRDTLLGERKGLTIIGPATIVKEIKKDPDKIELLTEINHK